MRLLKRLTQKITYRPQEDVGELVVVTSRRTGRVIQATWWPADTHGEHAHLDHLPEALADQVSRELLRCSTAGEARLLIDIAFERAQFGAAV